MQEFIVIFRHGNIMIHPSYDLWTIHKCRIEWYSNLTTAKTFCQKINLLATFYDSEKWWALCWTPFGVLVRFQTNSELIWFTGDWVGKLNQHQTRCDVVARWEITQRIPLKTAQANTRTEHVTLWSFRFDVRSTMLAGYGECHRQTSISQLIVYSMHVFNTLLCV